MPTCSEIWNGLTNLANQMIPQPVGPIPAGPMSTPTGGASPAAEAADTGGAVPDEDICQECLECELITEDMVRSVFPSGPGDRITAVTDGLNINITSGKIDNEKRISHFLGQVRQETGARLHFREILNYSSDALYSSSGPFSYYRGNRARADRDARNEEAIANNAYADANRSPGYRLGNTQPGDGWRYRGRGLKQLTGRDNYRRFSVLHERIWGEAIDFEASPELLDQPIYAVRSALGFWVDKGLYGIADMGVSRAVADRITAVINRSTSSYADRWRHVESIYSNHTFRNVCFNTSFDLANGLATVPFGQQ